MRRFLPALVATALVAGCGSATTPSSPSALATATIAPSPTVAAPPVRTSSPTGRSCPTPPAPVSPPDTGWPTTCRDGITLAASWGDVPVREDGMGEAPETVLEVRLAGLEPGEHLSLRAVATYRIGVLGCGRTPPDCDPGSGSTRVVSCRPIYAETANGSTSTTADVIGAPDGTATATMTLLVDQARRPCAADPALPWYQRSAEWTGARVTESTHRLAVSLPDWIIGP